MKLEPSVISQIDLSVPETDFYINIKIISTEIIETYKMAPFICQN